MRKFLTKAILTLSLAMLPAVSFACGGTDFIGTICTFAFNFCPKGYAKADGTLLPISQNQALFALLGTTYGGDGVSTFALPDLRSRAIVGTGQGVGLSNIIIGEQGGQESVALAAANLPKHAHKAVTLVTSTLRGTNAAGTITTPQGNILAKPGAVKSYLSGTANVSLGASSISSTATTSIGATGSGVAFNNRQPYLGVTTCIALFGIFPSQK
jgi:microcystin-dependent protein